MMKPHTRRCCSCLTADASPGDTFCDPCRYQFDRDADGQMSWPAATALATDHTGQPIQLHPDQLDLATALDQEPTRHPNPYPTN